MIRKFLNQLAENPKLFEVFERIFGADSQKKLVYRKAFKTKKRLLDFGCSTGNTTEAFLDFDYVGIDLDPGCIRYAKGRWKEYPNIKFIAKDIFKKPFKSNYFDYILFAGTGHHISDDLFLPIFRELQYTLKKGGELWFYDILKPQKNSPLLTKLLAHLDRGRYIRSLKDYEKIFNKVKEVRITEKKVYKITDTLIPQEDYCFFRIQKLN